MLLPFTLSALTEFAYYNFVFDGIILFFTIIYFFAGFKRGMKRTLWYVVFDVISIVATYCICKFACPLFINLITKVGLGLIPLGIRFIIDSLYTLILTVLIGIIAFLIIRFGVFKKILVLFDDCDYNLRRHKGFFGRVVAAVLTAGLAYTLSAGVIVATRKVTGNTLFRNYESEMSETYVAKYANNYIEDFVKALIDTKSIEDPNNVVIKTATEGKYTYSDVPYYLEGVQRLAIAHDAEGYLNAIIANEDAGLERFNHDLHVWVILAEQSKNYDLLDELVAPIANKAVELNYIYGGNGETLFNLQSYETYFSSETYSNLMTIYYTVDSSTTPEVE